MFSSRITVFISYPPTSCAFKRCSLVFFESQKTRHVWNWHGLRHQVSVEHNDFFFGLFVSDGIPSRNQGYRYMNWIFRNLMGLVGERNMLLGIWILNLFEGRVFTPTSLVGSRLKDSSKWASFFNYEIWMILNSSGYFGIYKIWWCQKVTSEMLSIENRLGNNPYKIILRNRKLSR